MSYDIHGTWDATIASLGPHVQAHTNLTEISEGLKLFWKNGIPSSKLVLGLAAYGRSYTLADPTCTSPGCIFTAGGNPGACTQAAGFLALFEIENILAQDQTTPVYDAISGTNYFVYGGNQWVSYDSVQTFQQKVDFASANCLHGVLTWSIDMNNDGTPQLPVLKSPRVYKSLPNTNFIPSGISSNVDTYLASASVADCTSSCDAKGTY